MKRAVPLRRGSRPAFSSAPSTCSDLTSTDAARRRAHSNRAASTSTSRGTTCGPAPARCRSHIARSDRAGQLEARHEPPAPVRTESELELPVQPLDLVERELVATPMLLSGGDRLTLDELAGQRLTADEDVHWIGQAGARRRGNQPIEEDKVGREPAVSSDIPVAGRAGIIPAERIGGMQAVPLLPRRVELPFSCEDGEVHVANASHLGKSSRNTDR